MALTRASLAAASWTASQELAGQPSFTKTISNEGTKGSSAATSWRCISATHSPHLYTGKITEISTGLRAIEITRTSGHIKRLLEGPQQSKASMVSTTLDCSSVVMLLYKGNLNSRSLIHSVTGHCPRRPPK